MSKKFKSAGQAAYKLHVYFVDEGTGTYYSRDWQNSKYLPDRGLNDLIRYVERNVAKIKNAMIYDKRGGRDIVIGKYLGHSKTWIIKPSIH